MSAISWLFFAALALAALVSIVLLYRMRETPGRGRGVLAMLRWAAVALVLLLLFDPELPTAELIGGSRARQVIADASLSMDLPDRPGNGSSRWARQVDAARRVAGGRNVLLFGDEVRVVDADSLPAEAPRDRSSRLLPGLQAASEAGARHVTVLTDGAIDDAAQVARWLPRLGLDIDYRLIAEPVPNAAVAELEAPGWAQAGEPFEIRFGVAGVGMEGDSLDVRLLQDGETLATERVVVPAQGRVAASTLSFTPIAPAGAEGDSAGLLRYDVQLGGGDAAPDDDVRSVYVHVSDEPAGIVLLSFRPDWEPRFLLPVLEQALGMPARGYLRVRDEEYVVTGRGLEAGARVPEEDVRRAASAADLLVVHGAGPNVPSWLAETSSAARRMIVLPAGGAVGLRLPVDVGSATPGEWYVDPDVPATPVAPLLAGLDVSDAPPLTALRFAEAPAGAWGPMRVSQDRRGAPAPLALAGESEGRRWAVALGEGYWRWMFREGPSRDLYVRLWASLAGWIMSEHGAIAAAAVRPASAVVARGAPVRWIAPGLDADSFRVQLTDSTGAAVMDTAVIAQRDTALTAPLPPGHYTYRLDARAAGESAAAAEGEITVESYSPEFTRPIVTLESLVRTDVPVGPDARRAPARPLHATAWPYVLILLLIALEWILRRRWGLR